jgi:molybdopterin converting factor small subunit
VNVFVNDEDIRYLDEMNTAVTDGVIVALIPAVAGG